MSDKIKEEVGEIKPKIVDEIRRNKSYTAGGCKSRDTCMRN
jgi:hypothetical protein